MNIFKRFFINVLAASYLLPSSWRIKIYNLMGLNLHAKGIRAKCFFNSNHVIIGKNSSVNFFCQFHSTAKSQIVIGNNCFLGMNVTMCTITHEIGSSGQRAGEDMYYPIEIKDGCWIGANTTILPGVTIGEGCIIAAGAVVNKDCKTNGLYAGVPAKRVKELN